MRFTTQGIQRWDRFINSLNIPGVGPKTANRLAERFKGLIPLANADVGELQETKGVSAAAAEKIRSFFNRERHRNTISRLIDAGVNWPDEEPERLRQHLAPATKLYRESVDTDGKDQAAELPAADNPEQFEDGHRTPGGQKLAGYQAGGIRLDRAGRGQGIRRRSPRNFSPRSGAGRGVDNKENPGQEVREKTCSTGSKRQSAPRWNASSTPLASET